jgi:tetratricopeptide (TPR) repeat protein
MVKKERKEMNNNESPDYASLAEEYRQKEQWKEAAECYEQYLKIHPEQYGAWYNLAIVYSKLENRERAADCWSNFLKTVPDDEENKQQIAHAKQFLFSSRLLAAHSGKNPDVSTLMLKFYPRGKFRINLFGPKQYLPLVEECLKFGVCDAWAQIDKEAFAVKLREKKIPEEAIAEYLNNVNISDDMWAESAY